MFKNLLEEDSFSFILLFTLLSIVFILVPPLNETILRIVFGIPWVIFLPGYSVIGILFSEKNNPSIIETTALSLILSFAIVSFLGLALNYTPFGIRLESVFFALSTLTISIFLISWVRMLKLPPKKRFNIIFENLFKAKKSFEIEKLVDKVLSTILIASIIFSSMALVYVVAIPRTGECFTEFYLIGLNGIASNYPTHLKVGEDGEVIIGIVNHEYEKVNYCLEVNFNGTPIYQENVFLIENEKMEIHFTFRAINKGEKQKLEFLLYKDRNREAYRTLHLWVSVT